MSNAFVAMPGQCFRLVADDSGRAGLCSLPAAVRGRLVDDGGNAHVVWACAEHAEELDDPIPL